MHRKYLIQKCLGFNGLRRWRKFTARESKQAARGRMQMYQPAQRLAKGNAGKFFTIFFLKIRAWWHNTRGFPVQQSDESESGQMVFEKMKWAYSDAYLCRTIGNHAKNSRKRPKRPTSVFLQGDVGQWLMADVRVRSSLLKIWKTRKTKTPVS